MSKLADLLNRELENRGWSKRELARRAGVSSAQVVDVTNEQSNPGADFCIAVARALGEPPERLLRVAGILPPLPQSVAEENEIVNIFRTLTEDERQIVLHMFRGLERARLPAERAPDKTPEETQEEAASGEADVPLEDYRREAIRFVDSLMGLIDDELEKRLARRFTVARLEFEARKEEEEETHDKGD